MTIEANRFSEVNDDDVDDDDGGEKRKIIKK